VLIAGSFLAVGVGRVSLLFAMPIGLLTAYVVARRGLL
jgi:hypothetical protein